MTNISTIKKSLKPLDQPKPNFMWNLIGKTEHTICKTGFDHMTKINAVHVLHVFFFSFLLIFDYFFLNNSMAAVE